jgi:D-alanyl-D-alanine carboxypeptidase
MNATARQLGLAKTHFTDPSGLPDPGQYTTYSTAHDLIALGRDAMKNKTFAAIVAARGYTVGSTSTHRAHTWKNLDPLLGKVPGAIGIKTGFTERAHSTIVAAERKGGRTLIAVALQTDDMYDDVRSMFAYGFATQASPRAEVLGSKPGSNSSSRGPTPLEPTPAQGGGQTPRTRQTPSTLAPVTNPILEHLLPAPLPILATAAVTLLVIGSVVTALSRSQRR